MTTFQKTKFAGIHIITSAPGGIGRRERFILSIAIGAGLGVTLVPGWTQNNLWPVTDGMSSGVKSFRDAVIITLSTGYRCVAWELSISCNAAICVRHCVHHAAIAELRAGCRRARKCAARRCLCQLACCSVQPCALPRALLFAPLHAAVFAQDKLMQALTFVLRLLLSVVFAAYAVCMAMRSTDAVHDAVNSAQ